MQPTIEIATTCTWFQRRLCWMMSSIISQMGDVPHIIFNVAYPSGNGDPSTEDVCRFFKNRNLDIKETVYPDMETIQYRGLVRNRQLSETKADWMIFTDCDMTYHPMFFDSLFPRIKSIGGHHDLFTAPRISLNQEYCLKFFSEDKRSYPCFMEAAGRLEKWPVYEVSHPNSAGYFQMVNVENMRSNFGGIYVNAEMCQDWSWEVGQWARSDRQFHKMIGGYQFLRGLPPQYHLNHQRDKDCGHHITIQR